jgi:hypothetical protein
MARLYEQECTLQRISLGNAVPRKIHEPCIWRGRQNPLPTKWTSYRAFAAIIRLETMHAMNSRASREDRRLGWNLPSYARQCVCIHARRLASDVCRSKRGGFQLWTGLEQIAGEVSIEIYCRMLGRDQLFISMLWTKKGKGQPE